MGKLLENLPAGKFQCKNAKFGTETPNYMEI